LTYTPEGITISIYHEGEAKTMVNHNLSELQRMARIGARAQEVSEYLRDEVQRLREDYSTSQCDEEKAMISLLIISYNRILRML
jgi:hypothetical protein